MVSSANARKTSIRVSRSGIRKLRSDKTGVVIDKRPQSWLFISSNATPGAPLRFLPRGMYRRRNGLECAWFNQLSRSMKILRFEAGKLSGTSYNQEDAR